MTRLENYSGRGRRGGPHVRGNRADGKSPEAHFMRNAMSAQDVAEESTRSVALASIPIVLASIARGSMFRFEPGLAGGKVALNS